MENYYPIYKPFRNYLRQFEVLESLAVLYSYSQFIHNKRPLPSDTESIPSYLFLNPSTCPHDFFLERIAVEVIINGSKVRTKDTLRKWNNFSGAVNRLKELENELVQGTIDTTNIMSEMIRITHRQFKWQQQPNDATIMRYYKIFSQPALRTVIEEKLGITLESLFRYTFMLYGGFLKHHFLIPPAQELFDKFGWDPSEFHQFLNFYARSLVDLRGLLIEDQEINDKFVYAYHSLVGFPIILCEDGKYACPFPRLLLDRTTSGIFYDILGERGFSQAWGDAFQVYEGEVLRKCRYSVLEEREYETREGRKRSVDWILTNQEQAIFLECKAKRATTNLKENLDPEVLKNELEPLAEAVFQTYKGIRDCEQGLYPHFQMTPSMRVWPIVVTLEEWWATGEFFYDMISKQVEAKLTEASIPLDYLTRFPFTICSATEIELLVSALNRIDMSQIFTVRFDSVRARWFNIFVHLKEFFAEEFEGIRKNVHFHTEFEQLMKDIIKLPST